MEVWEDRDASDVKIKLPLSNTRLTDTSGCGGCKAVEQVVIHVDPMLDAALERKIPTVCFFWKQGRDLLSFSQMGLNTALEFGLVLVARCITAKSGGDVAAMTATLQKLRAFVGTL